MQPFKMINEVLLFILFWKWEHFIFKKQSVDSLVFLAVEIHRTLISNNLYVSVHI